MPTFKLDGSEVDFAEGETIMQAAWRAGVEIPHYCWHPGLSVAANCRMCLVHITSARPMMLPTLRLDPATGEYVPDTKPKLVPACQTPAAPNLEVAAATSELVQKTQASVQELLLLNHPVDCPICDQAGECKLQDYYYEHQHELKRKRTPRVQKPKGVRFGEKIVYDAERCIMCTRCIRVCDELVGDHVLDMENRGNRNQIVLAPGRTLDHDYALMTEHVCPVGALTSRDFRFKARVWFLRSAQGICTGCATGCNTHVDFDARTGEVVRLRPRDNVDVNQFWMCDDGMLSYAEQTEDRVITPTSGRGATRRATQMEDAVMVAAQRLAEVPAAERAIVLSALHSVEDNTALAMFGAALGATRVFLAARGGWRGDNILRNADNNPNRAGALRAANGLVESTADLVAAVERGEVRGILALGGACAEDLDALQPLTNVHAFISLASHIGPLSAAAALTIPTASVFESRGTFVNAKGMAQAFAPAVKAPLEIEAAWSVIARIAQSMKVSLPYTSWAELSAKLPREREAAE